MGEREDHSQTADAAGLRGGEAESLLETAETVRLLQAQKLQSLGLVACGIAHDFNNILTGVIGNIQLALDSLPPDAAGRQQVIEIEAAARRAAELAKELLAFGGRGASPVEPVDLSELVADAKQLFGVVLPDKRRVIYDPEEGIGAIEADATQVRQVLLNLITNAAEASEDPYDSISVRTRQKSYEESDLEDLYGAAELAAGDYICLEVSDSGVGIPEEAREKLFEPFFTTKETGSGLGLAAVLEIVQRHGGGIQVRSKPGEGTTFTVLFPRSDQPVVVTSPAPSTDVTWVGSGTVLVVDDEVTVRTVVSAIAAANGFEVLTAKEGREAIRVLEQHPAEIDVALVDLSMPGIDGVEAIGRMRDIQGGLKTILMSGYDKQEMEALYPACSIDTFLQKPFDSAQLMARLREALDSPGGHRERAHVDEAGERDLAGPRKVGLLACASGADDLSGEDSLATGDEGRPGTDRLAVLRKAREIEERERKTVLVVADEPDLRSLVRASLEPHDLHVIEAEDGISALARVREAPPGTLVVDQAMTETTCIELIRIRAENALLRSQLHAPRDAENSLELQGGDTQKLEATVSAYDRLSTELERAHYETALHLIKAARLKTSELSGHLTRIGLLAAELARGLDVREEAVKLLAAAAPLHDIGKIGVPDAVLLKPGPLNSDEWELAKRHTVLGARILSNSSSRLLHAAREIALTHHERWDGSGYPSGLKGAAIPLFGRIVMLVDQYDALRSERPYKPPFDHHRTCGILLDGDGRTDPGHFDPTVLEVFADTRDRFEEVFDSIENGNGNEQLDGLLTSMQQSGGLSDGAAPGARSWGDRTARRLGPYCPLELLNPLEGQAKEPDRGDL
jgi:response regulator RpfG family c-di-GMP phosphodiesterase/nitrogen-specific signal transduction histidine kinase